MKFTCFRILFAIVVFAFVFSVTSGVDIFALDKKDVNPQSKTETDIRDAQPKNDDESDMRRRINEWEEREEEESEPDEKRRHEEDEEEEPYKYPIEEETEKYETD